MSSVIIPVDPFDLVIFGATGDLTRRKLLPALYQRDRAGQLPPDARVIGAARTEMASKAWRAEAQKALEEFVPQEDLDPEAVKRFLGRLEYVRVDAGSETGWPALAKHLEGREALVRAFYLAVGPAFFGSIAERLKAHGLVTEKARLIVEKPLGHDLASAHALNDQLRAAFPESGIYRIDHYLGKETVQNLMALRFANALFEPLWNAQYVDHVQITVAETVGLEGRGGYYDQSGAMRDMVQNHLLQLLCLTAMEPPAVFDADGVRDEKLKVLRSLAPISASNAHDVTARGQYGGRKGEKKSYLEDLGLQASNTETFVAIKAEIRNWRWAGTPFYLRTGKRLRARSSEIAVIFRHPPHMIFPHLAQGLRRNALIMRLQPDEGVTLRVTVKEPGPGGMRLREAALDMTFADALNGVRMPDAYERLVMDVIRGDQTLFMRGDEVEAAWAWIDPILAAWAGWTEPPAVYDPDGRGPEDALRLIHQDGRRWREIEP
ncbi:glucose-6-phosphate dehydrogenase [Neomegalonema perideroedes]|uniref:glucose-6-phosphate dehydrogenase n=1 Tax=Neomegalonema perideroedes TaxID=217219 RepID=UPI000379C29F|nr:glucose-6-phosphate dehydrogenase [Neomegalonema perideroedes]